MVRYEKVMLCGLILRMRMFYFAVGYFAKVDKRGHNDTIRYKKVIPIFWWWYQSTTFELLKEKSFLFWKHFYQVQWSLEGEKEFSITLNGIDLSQFSTDGNCFKLYLTKDMWQFILLDGALGRAWHVQWGFEEKNRWIKRIEEFNR